MKKGIRIFGIIVLVVLLAVAISAICIYQSFKPQINAMRSIMPVDTGLYVMTYHGDYGIDKFVEQGGVCADKDLEPFLTQVFSRGLVKPKMNILESGCSTIDVANQNGGYLFGRNFDWKKECLSVIVTTYPKNGYASISTSCLDFLGMASDWTPDKDSESRMLALASIYATLDGINEKGLCVADLFAGDHEKTDQNRGNLNVTTTSALRLLLDKAATTDEAVEMLGSWDMHSSIDYAHHFAISDATGHSVVVEWVNNEMVVIDTPTVTNHYLTECKNGAGIGTTHERLDTLNVRLPFVKDMETMTNLLQEVSFADYTGWSVIFNTQNLSATYYWRTNYDKSYGIGFFEKEFIESDNK